MTKNQEEYLKERVFVTCKKLTIPIVFLFIILLTNLLFANADVNKDFLGKKPYMPDIETFMQIGGVGSPLISPDGKIIYFKTGFTGVNQIYRVTEDNLYPYQLTFFKEGVGYYKLSPDGKWIAFLADKGGNEQYQLFLMDAKTGRVKQLTDEQKARFGYPVWSPKSDKIYFKANIENPKNFDIYKLDLKTGNRKLIMSSDGYFGPDYVSEDGKLLLCYEYMSNTNSNLYILDLPTGRKKLITPHKGSYNYWGFAITPDNKKVFCISNNNKQGVNKLAEIDIDTSALKFIYDKDSPWGVDAATVNPQVTTAAITINREGYGILKLLDLKTGKELPSPDMKGIAESPIFSKTNKMVFSENTSVSVSEIYTWDWKKKNLKQITYSSYAGIDPSLFIEPKLIKYKSFDGLEIPAFLWLPPGWEKKKGEIPFIINFHGGPESQVRPYFQRHFNYLLLNGYGIMAPNIRGSSGYGKKYGDMDNYKKRMDSVKDGYYAAKYLIDKGYTKKGKIGIKGGSYGGFMVMALLTEYPDMWGAGLESIGIVDFVNFLKNTSDYRRKLRESEYGPLSDPKFLKSVSPIHKIDRIKAPLMVVHGKNDPRVPVSEAYLIIDNLKKRGIKVEALIFPDEGHGARKRKNRLKMYRTMVEFFDRHLK